MKLSEKKGGDFQPHPETEDYIRAVIVDITPLKTRQTQHGDKEEFRLVYETEMEDDDGKRFCIWSRPYTPSLNEKANFRKEVKKILGRDLTKLECAEFETESLIGMGVKLEVVHAHVDDQVFANISTLKQDKTSLKPSGKYVRVKDREQKADGAAGGGSGAGYRKAPATTEDEGRKPWQKVKVHIGKHSGVDLGDLDEEAVGKLIEKWLPVGKSMAKPLKADRELIAALEEVVALLGGGEAEAEAPAAEEDY